MKDMGKIILFFEKCIYTFYGAIKIVKSSRFRAKLKIQDTQGDVCCILGNGPSLNKDLSISNLCLDAKKIFAVNHFVDSELYEKLKPQFYVFADPGFYVDNINQQEQMKINNSFSNLKEKTTWPITIFAPFEGQKRIQNILKENQNISVVGYNNVNTWKGFKWFDRWVYDNQWAIFSGVNVLMAALSLSIKIGFKTIYLLGADHSWHKNLFVGDNNVLYWYDTHFYNEHVTPTPVVVEEKNKVKDLKLHEWLGYVKKAFEVYHYIEDYAKYKKVKIINCTADSFIDAFERLKQQ